MSDHKFKKPRPGRGIPNRTLINRAASAIFAVLITSSPIASSIVLISPVIVAAQTAKPASMPPMPPNADPAFDVATIKPSDTSAPHGTFFITRGRHVIAYNISVEDLIAYAYGLHAKQIVDGPSSILNAHFDIDGLPDIEGRPNLRQSRLMYQKLLQSRFKLTLHYENRELSVYAVVIAKSGPRLQETEHKPSDSTNFSYTNKIVLTVRNASMADFVKDMQETFMDRPMVDQTGLKERYDFDLKWTPDESPSGVQSPSSDGDANAPPGLFTAIQEQLGLKLVSTKAQVQAMVIDHIEKPTAN